MGTYTLSKMPLLRPLYLIFFVLCCSVLTVQHVDCHQNLEYHELLQSLHTVRSHTKQSVFPKELGNAVLYDETNAWKILFDNNKYGDYGLSNISLECSQSLTELMTGIQNGQFWALQMVDASAKIDSGLLGGNTAWPGSYDECIQIKAFGQPDNNGSVNMLFRGRHVLLNVNNVNNTQSIPTSKPYPGIFYGICMPDTCSSNDSLIIANSILPKIPFLKNIGALSVLSHPRDGYAFDTAALVVLWTLLLIVVVLAMATCYDIIFVQMASFWIPNRKDSMPIIVQSTGASTDSLNMNRGSPKYSANEVADGKNGWFPMLMTRLSVYSNGCKLLHTSVSSDSLQCINGIRFFSMTWVMLGHTYAFITPYLRNEFDLYNDARTFAFQAIGNALVSVDSFFLLSGTLVSYLLLKELRSKGGPKELNWAKFYFHRFWRLTPPYMIILGAHTALFKYIGDGPFWPEQGMDQTCETQWWSNLLYINNLTHKECMGWAWYLANDMQFYIISPIFVVALYWNKVLGTILCTILMLVQLVSVAVLTYVNDFPAELMEQIAGKNAGEAYMNKIYFAPWSRVGPYAVGLLLGYIILETPKKINIKWYLNLVLWAVAGGAGMGVVYGLYHVAHDMKPLDTEVATLYASTHRLVWAIALGWCIFACVKGHGGPINKLLSWPALIPLSRLTYMAYLIHPVVMSWYYYSARQPFVYNVPNMVYIFMGHLTLSYGLAFLGSLAFEAPMMGLEKVLFSSRQKKSEPNPATANHM